MKIIAIFAIVVFCASCATVQETEEVCKGVVFDKRVLGEGNQSQYSLFVRFNPGISQDDPEEAMCVVSKEIYNQARPGDSYDFVRTKHKNGQHSTEFRFIPRGAR